MAPIVRYNAELSLVILRYCTSFDGESNRARLKNRLVLGKSDFMNYITNSIVVCDLMINAFVSFWRQ